jgi:hypothetical protein
MLCLIHDSYDYLLDKARSYRRYCGHRLHPTSELMDFSTINDPEFVTLKHAIEAHPRLCGYYIIDTISITALRTAGASQAEILDKVIAYFDDTEKVPHPNSVPDDSTWLDYEVGMEAARDAAFEALVGGPGVGHLHDTIPPDEAEQYFTRFVALFESDRQYYVGLGIGNYDYVFQRGVLVVDQHRAGILWVVESD